MLESSDPVETGSTTRSNLEQKSRKEFVIVRNWKALTMKP